MTLPELLEDPQVDKKSTKDFQHKLAMNRFTGIQLSSTCEPRSVDGSQAAQNGSGICHLTLFFGCSGMPEKEAGVSKEDGCRSLSQVTSVLHLAENQLF